MKSRRVGEIQCEILSGWPTFGPNISEGLGKLEWNRTLPGFHVEGNWDDSYGVYSSCSSKETSKRAFNGWFALESAMAKRLSTLGLRDLLLY